MVPAIVILDGVQIGHPVDKASDGTTSCDQVAAIGVADGIVRGVSHHIGKGFAIGLVGTGGELIEFREGVLSHICTSHIYICIHI